MLNHKYCRNSVEKNHKKIRKRCHRKTDKNELKSEIHLEEMNITVEEDKGSQKLSVLEMEGQGSQDFNITDMVEGLGYLVQTEHEGSLTY